MLAKVINSNEPVNITPTVVGYDVSKYNAFKHGVLSKYTVMQWENREDYEALMNSLINEYAPSGITEEHLVEELAGIIWRKMRLRYAEMSSLQSSLSKNVGRDYSYCSNDSAKEALLASSHEVEKFDIKEAILSRENETQDELRIAKECLECCLVAEKILEETNSYEDGLAALPRDDRDNWDNKEGLKGSKYGSLGDRFNYVDTPESLLSWVIKAKKHYEAIVYELENRPKVKQQILGKSFLSDKELNKYARYENHLDKKFEKHLAMLLKLKDLRATNEL